MNLTKTFLAAGAMALAGGAANAATYDVSDISSIGIIECENCEWVYSLSSDDLTGPHLGDGELVGDPQNTTQLYIIDPQDNSIENEIDNLNELIALSGEVLDYTDFIRDESGSWDSDITGWLIFKFGGGLSKDFEDNKHTHLFVYNYGGNVSYEGEGLSHVTYIPLPAAGFLLLGGLGGLLALRRRKS